MSKKAEVVNATAKVVGRTAESTEQYGTLKVEAKVTVEFEIEGGYCRDCGWDQDDMRSNPIDHFNHCYRSTRLVG
jgi:hypothetical protein